MSEIEELRDEVERLTRWKSEATEVILGLQDLGRALELPLGERITGEAAAEAARTLKAEVERLRAAVTRVGEADQRTIHMYSDAMVKWNARAESAEAALTSEREAHSGQRARLQALADEHEAWMSLRVPAHDLFERDSHRAFVADLRAALADVTPAVQGDTGDAPLAGQEAVCAHDVGDLMPCRCLLPRGHAGLHKCVHTRPTPSGSDEQGNRPATPDANGVHDTKGR